MASAQKKVVIRTEAGVFWGYLPPTGLLAGDKVELVQVDARTKHIALNDIQAIFYVRDFNLEDAIDPERVGRRTFPVRPKSEGLWIRLEFHSLAPLEGLISIDLGFLDTLLECQGLFITPPDSRGNTTRVFFPRHSIRSLEVLGLITSPARKLAEKTARKVALALQAGLFDDPQT